MSIVQVLNLSLPDETGLDRADANLLLVGEEMQLKDIELRGPGLALIGERSIRLPDQQLDARLMTVSPHRWANVPVVTELIEGAAREMVEVQVQGTLSQPRASARPLRGLSGAVNTLVVPKR